MTPKPLLAVHKLTICTPSVAVDGLSFELCLSETLAIVGESGSQVFVKLSDFGSIAKHIEYKWASYFL